MKLWAIEVTEYWDDRGTESKGNPHILPGRVWLSGRACRYTALGMSAASDHNTYVAVPIRLVIFDRGSWLWRKTRGGRT